MDTGTDMAGELHPVTIGRYLHSDKEHLFYFVFSYEFPADFPPPSVDWWITSRCNLACE